MMFDFLLIVDKTISFSKTTSSLQKLPWSNYVRKKHENTNSTSSTTSTSHICLKAHNLMFQKVFTSVCCLLYHLQVPMNTNIYTSGKVKQTLKQKLLTRRKYETGKNNLKISSHWFPNVLVCYWIFATAKYLSSKYIIIIRKSLPFLLLYNFRFSLFAILRLNLLFLTLIASCF